MTPIIVTDANIFIDLIEADALPFLFQMDEDIYTTEAILFELVEDHRQMLTAYILNRSLVVAPIDEIRVREIRTLESRKLSDPDCTVIALAEAVNGMLLSGDQKVIKVCRKYQLHAHGILWLFDEWIARQVCSPAQAHTWLSLIMRINTWLPARECLERLKQWEGE